MGQFIEEENICRIRIPCDANCDEEMEITKLTWKDINEDPDYLISFRIDSFYAGQSILGIIKRRLQLAWLALRKGNYYHQEIIVTEKELKELRDNLNKILD